MRIALRIKPGVRLPVSVVQVCHSGTTFSSRRSSPSRVSRSDRRRNARSNGKLCDVMLTGHSDLIQRLPFLCSSELISAGVTTGIYLVADASLEIADLLRGVGEQMRCEVGMLQLIERKQPVE